VRVDGHELALSNLDKALYPDGTTKAEVIDYYTRVAPVLLPHLADRQLTRIRFPNGADRPGFFEKNAPAGTPGWVRQDGGLIVVDRLATLVWLANLAALELHAPQWRAGELPDRVVFDLDPGEPAGLPECQAVAVALRDRLAADGLTGYPKLSGRSGMQVSAAFAAQSPDGPADYARRIAAEFARSAPGLITEQMNRRRRPGKVFIDWSQNKPAKTTICVYSLRAGRAPTVSAPLAWDEVTGDALSAADFGPERVLRRIISYGDLHAGLLPR
jgi:bifunctional non-homologous end joining protein LigD